MVLLTMPTLCHVILLVWGPGDLCTLDAFLAARYQGGVSPTASRHLRRRVVQNMFQPNGYVNFWSEFLVAHVFALADYSDDYGDVGVAAQLWDMVQDLGDGVVYTMANYSLWAYTNASGDGMVYGTPKPLVDWPRSALIDTDLDGSKVCNIHCVQMQVRLQAGNSVPAVCSRFILPLILPYSSISMVDFVPITAVSITMCCVFSSSSYVSHVRRLT